MTAKEAEILGKYLPAESIHYCYSLWREHKIQLTISRPRKSIYGNYRFRNGSHHISVNGNLQKEAFLVTYLHEVAHLITRKKYKWQVKPHGAEWQRAFSEIMEPMLHPGIFPDNILTALKNHLKNPAATSCADPHLHALLNNEIPNEAQLHAKDLKQGDFFLYQETIYEWRRKLRSYCEVRRLQDGKLYRISNSALVESIEDPMGNNPAFCQNPSLRSLEVGQVFFMDNRKFRKLEQRRSRALCEEIPGGIRYIIGAEREVIPEILPIAGPSVSAGAP